MKNVFLLIILLVSTLLYAQSPKDQTLNFSKEGIQFLYPKGYMYSPNRCELSKTSNDMLEAHRLENDTDSTFFLIPFYGAEGEFTFRSQLKDASVNDPKHFCEKGNNSQIIYYDNIKDTVLVVDGIVGKATFYGASYETDLHLCFENEDTYFSLNIKRININNISFFDRLLSSIKIKSSQKRVTYNKQKPLSSVLVLEERAPMTLDVFDIPRKASTDLTSFKCELTTLGMTIRLPEEPSKYTFRRGVDGFKVDIADDGGDIAIDIAPTLESYTASMRANYSKYSVVMYLNFGKTFSVEQATKDTFQYWNEAMTAYMKPYKSAGILTANDGSEWGVLFESSTDGALVIGGNNDYQILYDIDASSKEELMDILSLVYQFTMNK